MNFLQPARKGLPTSTPAHTGFTSGLCVSSRLFLVKSSLSSRSPHDLELCTSL